MKKFKWFGTFMTVVLMLGLVLAGCSGSDETSSDNGSGGESGSDGGSGEKIKLSFANWVSAEAATKKNIDKVISAFEEQHQNVTIKNVPIPFDQMRQQLLTKTAGGNPPDVMMLSGPWSQELGANGALIDLKTMASEEYLNDNYQGALDAGKYNGKLYAVPFELTPHAFWYNKKLMEKAGLDPSNPPQTLEELNAAMAQIKEKLGDQGIYPIGLDTTKIDYALVEFWPYFYMFDARPLYNNEINFDTPQVQNALSWLRECVKKGYTPVGQQIKVERELMAKNKIVFKLDGPYFKGILRSLNPKLKGEAFFETFGVAKVPVGKNGKSETLADIHQLGISTKTKHKDIAWEFVKFLASSKVSIKEYQIPYGALPPLKSDQKKYKELMDDPASQTFINEVFETMVGGPYGPKYGDAQQVIIQAMQKAVYKKDTPISEITKTAEQRLKQIYGK